jgi:Zn-dependent protease/predicted transcriptional regulator
MSADVSHSSVGAAARAAPRRWSVPIGRVFGIEIRVHATFVLIVPLFALASSAADGPGPVAGLAWLVVIFACVVVHELAHCFVGRRRGAIVHEIVLLPIGGVSKLERLPESPNDEFAMAIAGPLASLGLALLAGAGAFALGQSFLPIDLIGGAILPRIAWFNLIIGGFNLLPAFPLDGGRVFRALLERHHDLETATRIAARTGRMLALVLIAAGILVDLWLLIIGFFVYFGASAEEAATVIHLRLEGLRVRDVMLLDPLVVSEDQRAGALRSELRRSAQSVLPVVGTDGYVGVVAARVLASAPEAAAVRDLMIFDAPTVAPTASLETDALPLVERSALRAVTVVRRGSVVGLLREEDIAAAVASHAPTAESHEGVRHGVS